MLSVIICNVVASSIKDRLLLSARWVRKNVLNITTTVAFNVDGRNAVPIRSFLDWRRGDFALPAEIIMWKISSQFKFWVELFLEIVFVSRSTHQVFEEDDDVHSPFSLSTGS